MSDQDRRADGVDEDGDAAPMLVLGERGGPDVEDTTLEELRRQREELLEERAKAQERIRAERERAEADLQAQRERTEQELLERQRRIDDAERDLLAAERRVRRQAQRTGAGHTVPRVEWSSSKPLPPRGRLRAKGTAGLLVGAIAASAVVALVSAGTPPSEEEVREYAALAEGHLAWDEATRAFDDLIVTRMSQAGNVPSDEALVATGAAAEEVVNLVEDAELIAPLPYSGGAERAVTGIRAIAEDQSAAAVRPVNQWESQRYTLSDSATTGRVFDDAGEALTPGSALSWWMLSAMLLALAGLIRLALKDRAYIALALLGVAGITGIASMVYLGIYQQVGSMAENVQARDDAALEHRSVVSAQGRDLRTIFGVETSFLELQEYWTRDYYQDLDDVPQDIAQNYWDVRAQFATLAPEEQLEQAPELVDALSPVWDLRREQLAAANDAVVAAADDPPGVAALLLTTLGTAGLAAAALLVPSHRPDKLRTSASSTTRGGGRGSTGGARPGGRGDQGRGNKGQGSKGQGRGDSRTVRGRQNDQVRNTRRNTPAKGRGGRRGGRG